MEKDNDFIYYGAFISEKDRETFLKKCNKLIPEGWTVYFDHCTLLHHSDVKHREHAWVYERLLGKEHTMLVTSIGKSDKALALGVAAASFNDMPHITIATAPHAKPVESNNITAWSIIPPELRFTITGKIDKK